MMGGYLDRLVESGMTSMRELRGQIGRPDEIDHETIEELVTSNAPSLPREVRAGDSIGTIARPDPWDQSERGHSTALEETGRDPHAETSGAQVASRELPANKSVRRTTAPEYRDGTPVLRTLSPERPPSLRNAGIRATMPREEAAALATATAPQSVAAGTRVEGTEERRAPGDPIAVIREEGDAAASHGGLPRRADVPSAHVERWERLKERLLIDYPPTRAVTSAAHQEVVAARNPRSKTPDREIVIGQLEVIVAALPVTPPSAQARMAPRPSARQSGAWAAAARRYLGKL